MDDAEIVFKIIVVGQAGVGKTSILFKYMKGEFLSEYNVTVGVEFSSKVVKVNEKVSVKLQVWDTAGTETFKAIVRSFYKGIAAAFLVYSIDKEQSFKALKGWVKQVKQNAHQQAFLFLIGSKLDLQEKRSVSKQRAEQFLKEIGGIYFLESSAKTGQNIKQLFQKAAKIMYKKYQASGSFRNLVKPILASGFLGQEQSPQKSQSFNLNKAKVDEKNNREVKKKRQSSCC